MLWMSPFTFGGLCTCPWWHAEPKTPAEDYYETQSPSANDPDQRNAHALSCPTRLRAGGGQRRHADGRSRGGAGCQHPGRGDSPGAGDGHGLRPGHTGSRGYRGDDCHAASLPHSQGHPGHGSQGYAKDGGTLGERHCHARRRPDAPPPRRRRRAPPWPMQCSTGC